MLKTRKSILIIALNGEYTELKDKNMIMKDII